MFDLIASQEAIAFVGAGFSADLYPPWKTLLQKLRVETNKFGTFAPSSGLTEDQPLQFADEVHRYRIDTFRRITTENPRRNRQSDNGQRDRARAQHRGKHGC